MDQMGIMGYFPANVVKETQTFVQDTVKSPTTVSIAISFLHTTSDMNTIFPQS